MKLTEVIEGHFKESKDILRAEIWFDLINKNLNLTQTKS